MKFKFILGLLVIILLSANVMAALSDNLISYYQFENLTDSAGGNDLVNAQGLGIYNLTDALIGRSGHSNLTSSWYIPLFANFNFTAYNQTFNIWIRRSSVGTGNVFSSSGGWGLEHDTGGLGLTNLGGFGVSMYQDYLVLGLNQWTMLTIVTNDTGVKWYSNTTLLNETTKGTPTTNPVYIASHFGLGGVVGGIFDELGIWQRELSLDEITALYNNGVGIGLYNDGILVTLNSPATNHITSSSIFFNSTSEILGSGNLVNATLYVWHNNGTIFNATTNSMTGTTTNETTWNLSSFSIGHYHWNVLSCGTFPSTICSWALNNRTFDWGYTLNAETFTASVGDLLNSSFIINISLDSSIISSSANIIYNNVSYLATSTTDGNNRIFTRVLDIPPVTTTQTNEFYWNLILTDTLGTSYFNTTTNTQTVIPTNLTICSASYPVEAVNFSIFDEETDLSINVTTFDATLTWYLGSGAQTKNNSFSLGSLDLPSHTFCIYPNSTFITTSEITIKRAGYETRSYTFIDDYFTNISTLRNLYLLNSSDSTDVIIKLRDEGLTPLTNYLVEVYRFRPEENDYILVESGETDVFGQFPIKLVENEITYRLIFKDIDGNNAGNANAVKVVCSGTPCILSFTLIESLELFERFVPIADLDHNLSYNNNTGIFSFTWNDNTGDTATYRLEITRNLLNGTTIVFNQSSSATSGSMSYTVDQSRRATYVAQAFRTVAGDETRLNSLGYIEARVGLRYTTFGLEGMIIMFILLFTMIILGIYSPVVGIGIYLFGMIILWVTDLVYVDKAILFGTFVIGVLFVWALKS